MEYILTDIKSCIHVSMRFHVYILPYPHELQVKRLLPFLVQNPQLLQLSLLV